MNKNIFLILGVLLFSAFSFISCSESTGEVDPYANWEQRNQNYIDSIANVARANEGNEVGDWKIFRSYKLASLPMGQVGDVNDYVYCKINKLGEGPSPLFTDSAYVDYKGMMINNTIFDQTYKGAYNPSISSPVEFMVGGLVTGFTTALQNMQKGSQWTIYIPSDLCYGSTGSSTIPAYSTLIFDVALVRIVNN